MKQGIIANRDGASAAAVDHAGPAAREAALQAIREILSELAEDALRLGIVDCIPLITAADLAVEDALDAAATRVG